MVKRVAAAEFVVDDAATAENENIATGAVAALAVTAVAVVVGTAVDGLCHPAFRD